MALNEEVNATKLHQSRLGELEAELARLEGLHGAADAAHKDHLSRLEPLRTRHRSLQVLLGPALNRSDSCCQEVACMHCVCAGAPCSAHETCALLVWAALQHCSCLQLDPVGRLM
jgi:hypothetical protein